MGTVRKTTDDDIRLILECGRERKRLLDEAAKLSSESVAEKFGVGRAYVNDIWLRHGIRMRTR